MRNLSITLLLLLCASFAKAQCTAGVISGDTSICLGSIASYYSSVSGGSWSMSTTSIASVISSGSDTLTLGAVTSGTVTLTYSASVGCGVGVSTYTVRVGSTTAPLLTLTAPPFLLLGGVGAVSASVSGGTWVTTTPSVLSVSASGTVTAISVGTGTVSYSVTTSCGPLTSSLTVPVASATGAGISDSFAVSSSSDCSGTTTFKFYPTSPVSSFSYLRTFYGDGTEDSVRVSSFLGSFDTFSHSYSALGTYSVRHLIFSHRGAVDSVSYTLVYRRCGGMLMSFYHDLNRNCVRDAGEPTNMTGVRVAVDSNGIAVDTVSAYSGFYYEGLGAAGTIYSYRVVAPSSLSIGCPSSGILADTIGSASRPYPYYVGLRCASTGSADIAVRGATDSRTNGASGVVWLTSNSCAFDTGWVTLGITPRYSYSSASLSPVSVSGGHITWVFDSLSFITPKYLTYMLSRPGAALMARDTVNTQFSAGPVAGDPDTTNNNQHLLDTIRASYDPNNIIVSPAGGVLNGTQLTYVVNFQNDGNDTATNIHILDTLSADVDVRTLRVIGATAAMNVSYTALGARTIVKFDFPNIYLPDSSHGDVCRGFVMYTVNAKRGLADGVQLLNRAGIYFDANPVILTNTERNTIVVPTVSLSAGDSSICISDTVAFTALPHTIPNSQYQWYVNSRLLSATATRLVYDSLNNGDTVRCRMIATMDETVVVWSPAVIMSVSPRPNAGSISGRALLCLGDSVVVSATVASGTWSFAVGHATISGVVLRTLSAGADTLRYTVANSCASAVATYPFVIDTFVTPAVSITATPSGSVCEGDSVRFNAFPVNGGTAPSYKWLRYGALIDTGVSFTYRPSLGDVISCMMTSALQCVSARSATSAGITMYVDRITTPDVIVSTSADSAVAVGDLIAFHAFTTYATAAPRLQWYVNGVPIIGATNSSFSYHPVNVDTVYCVVLSSLPCATRTTDTSNFIIIRPYNVSVPTIGTLVDVALYPNPSNGSFTIAGMVASNLVNFEVADVTGRVLLAGTADAINGYFKQIVYLPDAASGQYLVKLRVNEDVRYLKAAIVR
jgi:hypothetical protein